MIKLAIYYSEEGIDTKIISWGEIQEIGYGDFYFCYRVDNEKHPQYIYLTTTEHRHVSVFINEKEYVITNLHSPSGPTINRLLKIKDKINALIVQENIKTAIDSLPG